MAQRLGDGRPDGYLDPFMLTRFGDNFPRLFAAAITQELSFALLLHFPGYLSGLGATEGLIGVLYSASAMVSIILRPWLGRVLDLTHRRTVLLFAGVVNFSIVFVLITTSAWGPYLWVLFLIQRTVQIAIFAAFLTYAADSIKVERRTQGMAIFGLSGLIPIALAGVVGDFLIDNFNFNALFLAAGVSGLISWLIVWTIPVLPVRGRQPRRSFWKAMTQRNMIPLWLAAFVFFVGVESLFTFTRTFVDTRQAGSTGLFFGLYGASAALTRILGGASYDRTPHRILLVSSLSLFGVGLVMLAFTEGIPLMVAAGIVTGTAHGVAFPLMSSEVVNRARTAERGSAMSIFTSIFDFALLFGAPSVGFMIDFGGYTVAFGVAGVLVVAGALVFRVWDGRLAETASAPVGEEVFE